jgi:endonuclease YncB( thermonuclease family)
MSWNDHPEYGSPWRWWDWILVPAIVLIAGLFAWSTLSASAQQREIIGIASVVDGDTIDIHGERIRLHGFDAPERNRPRCVGNVSAYQRSSLFLADNTDGRTVSCTISGSDDDRHVAACRVGGRDLGELMVESGWARDWPRYSDGEYADEEAQARASRRGVWGLECPGLWGNRNYSRH